MRLQILHVPDCPNVALLEQRIDEALSGSRDGVTLTRQVVDSAEAALMAGMTGSPTLLVDDVDPFAEPERTPSVSCRLYRGEDGRLDGAPLVAALRQALADVKHLATQLSGSLGGSAAVLPWLWPALLRALACCAPVTPDDLAAATGRSVEEVRAGLGALADTEYDEQGRIVGHGITLNPTPHVFEVGGHRLYTWCALDTLIFPAVIGQSVRVSSPCRVTGTPIHLEVGPKRVVSVEPATAVVSIITPDGAAAVRSAFCNQVHFFASPTAAAPWLREHPDTSVLGVRDAFDLGRQLIAALLAGDGPRAAPDTWGGSPHG